MKKVLLLLPIVLLSYACGGGSKEESKDKEKETPKEEAKPSAKEEEGEPAYTKDIVGRWKVSDVATNEELLKALPNDERDKVEAVIEAAKTAVKNMSYQFFKDGSYKMFKREETEESGTYEFKADGKDLVMKDTNGGEDVIEVAKLTSSELELKVRYQETPESVKVPLIYKMKK